MVRALAVTGQRAAAAVVDVPAVAPGPGQVRVAVEAASVNGIDVHVAAGHLWDLPHKFPVVVGRDFAGTVAAAGEGVELAVGASVAGAITGMTLVTGAIAESVTVDAGSVAAVPEGVAVAEAAAVGLAGVTALDLLEQLKLVGADVVLVTGATGGVGVLTVQLAALTGAAVFATARPEAADAVKALGAIATVDPAGDLAAQVGALAPHGLTAVVHLAGDPGPYAALLAPGGRFASALGATAEQAGRADVTMLPVMASVTRDKLDYLLRSVATGRLRVPVAGTYPLSDGARALADFAAPKVGKLVVDTAG